MNRKYGIPEFFMGFLHNLISIYGIMGCILSILSVEYRHMFFWAILTVVSLGFTLIFSQRRSSRTGLLLLASLTGFGIWGFWCRGELLNGILLMEKSVTDRANEVYRINLVVSTSIRQSDATVALLALAFLLSMITAYSTVYTFHRMNLVILSLIPFIGGLMLNKVVSVVPLSLCLLAVVSTSAGFNAGKGKPQYVQRKAALWMMLMGLLTGSVAWVLTMAGAGDGSGSSPLAAVNSEVRSFVNEHIWSNVSHLDEYFISGNSQSVLNGSLNREDGFTYTGARALEVTLSARPARTVYLKGYVGASYQGDSWSADDPQAFYEFAASNDWNVEQDVTNRDVVNLAYHTGEISGQMKADTMSVKRYTASALYAYYPYNVLVPDSMNAEGDGTIEGTEADQWEFPCYLPDSYEPIMYENHYLLGSPWETLEQLYNVYAQNTYTNYPAQQLPRLTAQCQEDLSQGIDEVTEFVKKTLGDGAVYNLNVGMAPEGEDFTEYFLYENQKEGYCVHFATAAVLMFRMKGIPARYVAGYIAPVDSFELGEDGLYHSMVRDQRAHAWAEIYVSGYGWLPVETTPGYAAEVTQTEQAQSAETVQPEETAGAQETATPIPEETQTATPSAEEALSTDIPSNERSTGSGWLWFLLVLILVLVVLVWRFGWIVYRRRIFRGDSNRAVSYIFSLSCDILKCAGLSEIRRISEPEFLDELMRKCPDIQREELEQFVNLAMAAEFGDKSLQRHQVMEMRRTYTRLCRSIYRRLSFPGKLRFRMWKVYF